MDRPAQLVGRRGEQLCQERYGAKTAGSPLRGGEPEQQQPAEREHREDGDHQVGKAALRQVDLVVADRGEADRAECSEDGTMAAGEVAEIDALS